MPSKPSAFPAPPSYPPLPPKKLSYNEMVSAGLWRSYSSAKMKAPRTVSVRRYDRDQSGGRRGFGPQRAE